jgi:hypothetical protein
MKRLKLRNLALLSVPLTIMISACDGSPSNPPGYPHGGDLQPGYSLLSEGSGIALVAEADAFEPGEPVLLKLENHSSENIGFNLCFHALEHRVDDQWVLDPSMATCTMHLDVAGPGQTAEYPTTLSSELEAGEYRFRIALYLMDQDELRDQVSDGFVVHP